MKTLIAIATLIGAFFAGNLLTNEVPRCVLKGCKQIHHVEPRF